MTAIESYRAAVAGMLRGSIDTGETLGDRLIVEALHDAWSQVGAGLDGSALHEAYRASVARALRGLIDEALDQVDPVPAEPAREWGGAVHGDGYPPPRTVAQQVRPAAGTEPELRHTWCVREGDCWVSEVLATDRVLASPEQGKCSRCGKPLALLVDPDQSAHFDNPRRPRALWTELIDSKIDQPKYQLPSRTISAKWVRRMAGYMWLLADDTGIVGKRDDDGRIRGILREPLAASCGLSHDLAYYAQRALKKLHLVRPITDDDVAADNRLHPPVRGRHRVWRLAVDQCDIPRNVFAFPPR